MVLMLRNHAKRRRVKERIIIFLKIYKKKKEILKVLLRENDENLIKKAKGDNDEIFKWTY